MRSPKEIRQAERVASLLAAKGVSSWRCKGFKESGAFDCWHITSTDINEACFPRLNSVIARGFTYAVAFHGFDDLDIPYDILVGGTASDPLKREIKEAIEGVVGTDFTVHITGPHERFGGDDRRNIVNRLTTGGANGIQIEQKGDLERDTLSLSPTRSPTSMSPGLGCSLTAGEIVSENSWLACGASCVGSLPGVLMASPAGNATFE